MSINYMSRPPHILIDNTPYLITSSTVNRIKFYNSNEKKRMIARAIGRALMKYDYKIYAWVVLANHYHILIDIKDSRKLSKFMQYINGSSSRWLREEQGGGLTVRPQERGVTSEDLTARPQERGVTSEDLTARPERKGFPPEDRLSVCPGDFPIWNGYWDTIKEDEKSFFKALNYIHYNPVKHGYVKLMSDYKFSSYNHYLSIQGQEWLDNLFLDYPIVDYD